MVRNIFSSIIRVFSRLILFSLGWKVDAKKMSHLDDKCVIIYPHSSYFDYFFFCLYYYAYNLDNIYTIVSERFIPFPSLCKTIISAPDCNVRAYMEKGYSRLESIFYVWKNRFLWTEKPYLHNKTNFVEKVCEQMKDKDNYKILISPTGSLTSTKWKSGYYHIATKLNIPIVICGVDYDKKNIVSFNSKNAEHYNPNREDINTEFDKISYFHNTSDIEIVNKACVLNLFFLFLNYYKFVELSYLNIIWICAGYFVTNLYYTYNILKPLFYTYKMFILVYSIIYVGMYKKYLCMIYLLTLIMSYTGLNNISMFAYRDKKEFYLCFEFVFGYSIYLLTK
jgi:1-acyl-sn-glycerol-3-phosphate acyltransferase